MNWSGLVIEKKTFLAKLSFIRRKTNHGELRFFQNPQEEINIAGKGINPENIMKRCSGKTTFCSCAIEMGPLISILPECQWCVSYKTFLSIPAQLTELKDFLFLQKPHNTTCVDTCWPMAKTPEVGQRCTHIYSLTSSDQGNYQHISIVQGVFFCSGSP